VTGMNAIARALSVALHPLFMPTYTFVLALYFDRSLSYFLDERVHWMMVGMVALMTIAFPMTSTALLIRAGLVRSWEMPSRQERIAPYTMTLLYYGMIWYLLARTALHPAAILLFGGSFAALSITTLITLRWKISAHMVGIGGCLGALVALRSIHALPIIIPIMVLIIVAGALGTARLLTSDHSPAQIYTGTAIGFASTFVSIVWF